MKILFLGNSHTYYNDMPQIFTNICNEMGKSVEVSMQAHAGVTYEWHLTQLTELRFALMYGGFEYIVMQQAAHSPCPSKEETLRDASRIIDMARAFGVTPIQTVPWAEKKYPQNQSVIYDIYNEISLIKDVKLNPVGYVFEEISKVNPEINLYWFDGEHASSYGSFANALTTFRTIFDDKVDGISLTSYAMYGGSQEEYDNIEMMFAEAKEDPELRVEALKLYRDTFSMVMDKSKLTVELNKDKAEQITKVINGLSMFK